MRFKSWLITLFPFPPPLLSSSRSQAKTIKKFESLMLIFDFSYQAILKSWQPCKISNVWIDALYLCPLFHKLPLGLFVDLPIGKYRSLFPCADNSSKYTSLVSSRGKHFNLFRSTFRDLNLTQPPMSQGNKFNSLSLAIRVSRVFNSPISARTQHG